MGAIEGNTGLVCTTKTSDAKDDYSAAELKGTHLTENPSIVCCSTHRQAHSYKILAVREKTSTSMSICVKESVKVGEESPVLFVSYYPSHIDTICEIPPNDEDRSNIPMQSDDNDTRSVSKARSLYFDKASVISSSGSAN